MQCLPREATLWAAKFDLQTLIQWPRVINVKDFRHGAARETT